VVREEPHEDGVADQRGFHPAARYGEVDDTGDQRVARAFRVWLGLGGVHGGFQPGELGLRGGDDDLVLGLELVVDGRLRHPDGIGDHLQRGTADAVLGEQARGGADDAGSGKIRHLDVWLQQPRQS
jgi:hypothetical protein